MSWAIKMIEDSGVQVGEGVKGLLSINKSQIRKLIF